MWLVNNIIDVDDLKEKEVEWVYMYVHMNEIMKSDLCDIHYTKCPFINVLYLVCQEFVVHFTVRIFILP